MSADHPLMRAHGRFRWDGKRLRPYKQPELRYNDRSKCDGHACTHARTHARTPARMHARTQSVFACPADAHTQMHVGTRTCVHTCRHSFMHAFTHLHGCATHAHTLAVCACMHKVWMAWSCLEAAMPGETLCERSRDTGSSDARPREAAAVRSTACSRDSHEVCLRSLPLPHDPIPSLTEHCLLHHATPDSAISGLWLAAHDHGGASARHVDKGHQRNCEWRNDVSGAVGARP